MDKRRMNIEKRKVWDRRGENNKCKAGKKSIDIS